MEKVELLLPNQFIITIDKKNGRLRISLENPDGSFICGKYLNKNDVKEIADLIKDTFNA